MDQPRPLFPLFSVSSSKHHYNFYNKYMWKNVHPVYGAGIRTHDLWNVSLFPLPLDQGSRPYSQILYLLTPLLKIHLPMSILKIHQIHAYLLFLSISLTHKLTSSFIFCVIIWSIDTFKYMTRLPIAFLSIHAKTHTYLLTL